jgi:hypothetical protein
VTTDRYSTAPLDLLALSDARGEIERLKADNERLRGLIAAVGDPNGVHRSRGVYACPWCDGDVPDDHVGHGHDGEGECPAFTPDGKLR